MLTQHVSNLHVEPFNTIKHAHDNYLTHATVSTAC